MGAYKGLMKEMAARKNAPPTAKDALDGAYKEPDGVSDYFDAQINFIKLKLQKRLEKVMDAPDAIAFVTYQMYSLVREFFIDELLTAPGFFDFAEEVTVLGGIMVNRGVGGDRFMPLLLQTRGKEDGSSKDLYTEAFGPKPDLASALGGVTSNAEIFDYSLDSFKLTDERKKLG